MEVTDHIDVIVKSPPEKENPTSNILSGAWMGIRDVLDALDEKKSLSAARNRNTFLSVVRLFAYSLY
jgi:hypothetical protein